MKRKYLSLFSLSGLILCLDQITKSLAVFHLDEGIRLDLIPKFMTLELSHNSGFALGLLGKVPAPFQDLFFIGIPVFALVLIVLIFIKLRDNQYLTSLALTTILAGAVGNLIDRVQHAYVIDFLSFHFGDAFYFPAFNVADFSIMLGVVIMFLNTLVAHPGMREEKA